MLTTVATQMLNSTDGIHLDYIEHEITSVIPNATLEYVLDDTSGAKDCAIGWHLRRRLCQVLQQANNAVLQFDVSGRCK